MVTKWYFRSSNASTGPTAKASTDSDFSTGVPSDKNTAKDMTFAKGSSQTSVAGAYVTASSPLYTMARIFVGPALGAQTLTGSQSNYKIGVAIMESNAQMNLYHRTFVYIWRSGTGNVKTIITPTSCGTEHGTAETGCLITTSGASGDFTTNEYDRIVVEVWWDIRNSKGNSYTATDYYEGTTDVVEATATSDAAAYFECPQTLTLQSVTSRKSAFRVNQYWLSRKTVVNVYNTNYWFGYWKYRKSHTINGSSGASTNYQVQIAVNRTTGTDAYGNIYVGDKCRSDFADIRFRNAADTDWYPCFLSWITNDGITATFWVKVTDNLDSNVTMYVYYGCPSIASASDLDSTFISARDCNSLIYGELGDISLTDYGDTSDPGDRFTPADLGDSVYNDPCIYFRSYGGKKYSISSTKTHFEGYLSGGNNGQCGFNIRLRTSEAPHTTWNTSMGYTANTTLNRRHIIIIRYKMLSGTGGVGFYSTWTVGDDIPGGNVADSFSLTSTNPDVIEYWYDGTITHVLINVGTNCSIDITSLQYAIAKYIATEPQHDGWGPEEQYTLPKSRKSFFGLTTTTTITRKAALFIQEIGIVPRKTGFILGMATIYLPRKVITSLRQTKTLDKKNFFIPTHPAELLRKTYIQKFRRTSYANRKCFVVIRNLVKKPRKTVTTILRPASKNRKQIIFVVTPAQKSRKSFAKVMPGPKRKSHFLIMKTQTWYLRSTSVFEWPSGVTGPAGTLSTDTDNTPTVPADKNTLKGMVGGKGSSQTSQAGTYTNAGPTKTLARIFVSPPLVSQYLAGSKTYNVGVGIQESNAAMDLFHRSCAYIWRSGSGVVRWLVAPTSCATEHGASETGCVLSVADSESSSFLIQENDRIVVELWWDIQNSKAVAYTATDYYDGTTDVSEGTATSDAASFFKTPQTLKVHWRATRKSFLTIKQEKVSRKSVVNVFPVMDWGEGHFCAKVLYLLGKTGAGSNYQFKVVVHRSSGSDYCDTATYPPIYHVYINARCRTDYCDVKFVGPTGTELSCWRQEYDNSSATIWFKLTTSVELNTFVVMYYNNPNHSTDHFSMDNTFKLGDHFPGSTLDTNKWYVSNPSMYVVQNSNLEIRGYNTSSYIRSKWGYGIWNPSEGDNAQGGPNTAVHYRMYCTQSFIPASTTYARQVTDHSDTIYEQGYNDFPITYRACERDSDETGSDGTTPTSLCEYKVCWVNGKVYVYKNESLYFSCTDQHAPDYGSSSHEGMHLIFWAGYSADPGPQWMCYDWIFIRKYIVDEPYVFSSSIEQSYYRIGRKTNFSITPGHKSRKVFVKVRNLVTKPRKSWWWLGKQAIPIRRQVVHVLNKPRRKSYFWPMVSTWYWDAQFHYRKAHLVQGASGSGTDYQVCMKVYKGTGTDGTEVIESVTAGKIYCDNYCKDDFGDIRFTSSDGTTDLSYWIEDKVDGNWAKFWVKVTENLDYDRMIYIYYGKPSASTTSSGSATFISFSEFDNLDAFTSGNFIRENNGPFAFEISPGYNAPSVSGGLLVLDGTRSATAQEQEEGVWSTDYGRSIRTTSDVAGTNFRIRAKQKFTQTSSGTVYSGFVIGIGQDKDNYMLGEQYRGGTSYRYIRVTKEINGTVSAGTDTSTGWTENTWYTHEVLYVDNGTCTMRNGSYTATFAIGKSFTSKKLFVAFWHRATSAVVTHNTDWIFAGKYNSVAEPTHGFFSPMQDNYTDVSMLSKTFVNVHAFPKRKISMDINYIVKKPSIDLSKEFITLETKSMTDTLVGSLIDADSKTSTISAVASSPDTQDETSNVNLTKTNYVTDDTTILIQLSYDTNPTLTEQTSPIVSSYDTAESNLTSNTSPILLSYEFRDKTDRKSIFRVNTSGTSVTRKTYFTPWKTNERSRKTFVKVRNISSAIRKTFVNIGRTVKRKSVFITGQMQAKNRKSFFSMTQTVYKSRKTRFLCGVASFISRKSTFNIFTAPKRKSIVTLTQLQYKNRKSLVTLRVLTSTLRKSFFDTSEGTIYVSRKSWFLVRTISTAQRKTFFLVKTFGSKNRKSFVWVLKVIRKSFFVPLYTAYVSRLSFATIRQTATISKKSTFFIYIPAQAPNEVLVFFEIGWTNSVPSDIGKPITDDGETIGTLLAYDNDAGTMTISTPNTVNPGSTIAVTGGTGTGVVIASATTIKGRKSFINIRPRPWRKSVFWLGSGTPPAWYKYSDVILSELRIAPKNMGVVALNTKTSYLPQTINNSTWTNMCTINIPTTDHERYYIQAMIEPIPAVEVTDHRDYVFGRLLIGGLYYPYSTIDKVPVCGYAPNHHKNTTGIMVFEIPKNLKGLSATLQLLLYCPEHLDYRTLDMQTYMVGWGIEQHTHG